MSSVRSRWLLASLLLTSVWLSACGGGSGGSGPTLSSVTVTPSPLTLAVGQTQQLTVTGHYSDGTTAPVTSSATFGTSAASIATVTPGGLVAGVLAGSATVTATASGKSATVAVTVTSSGPSANQVIFYGGAYGTTVVFQPFGGSTNDLSADATTTLPGGHGALKIVYPASGYTGGAFVDTAGPRNLSAYDAVTFWAKASAAVTFEKVGLGNNGGFSSNNGFEVERFGLALTTSWQKFVVPIPLASKLTATDGLFHFADGTNHAPVVIWLADVQYETLGAGALGSPVPAFTNGGVSVANGATYQVVGADLKIDYATSGVTLVGPSPKYFDFSSDSAAAAVSATGLITGHNATGTPVSAHVTATLGATPTTNKLPVTVTGTAGVPATLPPAPTPPVGATVLSLYSSGPGGFNGTASDKGGNVDTWLTCWSGGTGGDPTALTVGGQTASPRKYLMTNTANFVGVELLGKTGATSPGSCNGTITGTNELDISGMTHFHVDVWTPDDSSNLQFKLVDAGANGLLNGGETFGIATLTPGSTPPLATGQWLSYDLAIGAGFPGNNFPGNNASTLHHFGQLVIVAPNGGTVYVDNLYFYGAGGGGGGATAPTTAPAAPTAAAANVISLLSTAYTNKPVDTWGTSWSNGGAGPNLTELTIAGDPMKKYGPLAFVGIEFIGTAGANEIDATTMTHFHVDVWTPDVTNFQVKLVDFGADKAFGGGDDTEALFTATAATTPALTGTGQWVSLDIPLTSFVPAAGTWNRAHLAQLLFISGTGSGTVFVDNVYFHKAAVAPVAPTTAPAAPTAAAANVVSLLSTAYTNKPVDTWGTSWSNGGAGPNLTELTIAGDPMKKYGPLAFVGIEFIGTAGANEIDATTMTHFHVDVWTPDVTNFQVKLVDFGADKAFGGGDDTEALFTAHAGTTPALTGTGQWVSLDIPLASFVPAAATWNRAHLAQLLFISGTGSGTVFVDNVYFHK